MIGTVNREDPRGGRRPSALACLSAPRAAALALLCALILLLGWGAAASVRGSKAEGPVLGTVPGTVPN